MEPADVGAMDRVFEQLLADRSVTVNGAHWASLIHAHGCVKKDLDRALAIFESIKNHPSTKRSGAALPDAVAFEALINVFNTVRRTDLIPHYVAKLQEYGIHMTAYIANVLIRGYAMHGDIEQARAVFDSLVDPPEGIAAPNNHAPHDSEHPSPVPATAPVFREVRLASLVHCTKSSADIFVRAYSPQLGKPWSAPNLVTETVTRHSISSNA